MRKSLQDVLDALARGRRFVTHDVWHIGRPGEDIPHGLIIKHVRVTILLVQGFIRDALLLRASALTFVTMLAIVPLLIILLSVIQYLDLEQDIYGLISKQLFRNVAQQQKGTTSKGRVTPQEQGAETEDSMAQREPTADSEDGLVDPVDWLVKQAERGAQPKSLPLTAVVFIVASVFGLMSNIEDSFNRIWGLRRTRSWYRTFSNYVTIIVLLPFLVAGLLSATAVLNRPGFGGALAWGLSAARFVTIWLAFAAMYLFVPNTRVRFRYAVLGGVVAGSLWILLSEVYVGSQSSLRQYRLLYSAFAQVPLLLMWIYASWVIVLFGAELTFAYQNEKTFAMERLAEGASYAYREALALWTMIALGKRFDEGQPGLSVAESAEEWNVPTRLLNDTLDLLEDAGIVRRCTGEPVTFQPARSVDKIAVSDVISAMREAGRDPSALRDQETFRPFLRELVSAGNSLVGATIAELIPKIQAAPTPALSQAQEPAQDAAPQNPAKTRGEQDGCQTR